MANPTFKKGFLAIAFLSLALAQNHADAMDYAKSSIYAFTALVSKNKLATASAAITVAGGYLYHRLAQSYTPIRWNWKVIPYKEPQTFPKGFLFGTGTSAHQVEGNCTNNTWRGWEKSKDEQGNPRVESPSGLACDHWSRYKEDIKLMKEKVGVNSYRFSVEWSKIEPQKGEFSSEALKHYADVCLELIRNDIQPCITLHHYTDPLWFIEQEGKYGFENSENIQYYVRFATTVIKYLQDACKTEKIKPLYFTFNSPDGYAAQGYLTCSKPAGRLVPIKDMQLCAQTYKNLLEAHVQTYRAIKADAQYRDAQIGILKNMFPVDPYNAYNPLDLLGCYMASKIVDTPFFEYFTTGHFKTYIPFKVNVSHTNCAAIGALDFVGINYYSHGCMKNFKVTTHAEELTTNNDRYTLYAEGLYRVIKEMSEKLSRLLNKPIYITENGIATDETATNINLGEGKASRTEFLQKYLFALSKAVNDGYDVRGYMYWSFMDNYEWGTYSKKYGLFEVDLNENSDTYLKRTFKPSAQFYIDTIAHNI